MPPSGGLLPLTSQDNDPHWSPKSEKTTRNALVERSFCVCLGACALIVLVGGCIVNAGADDGAVLQFAGPLCNSLIAGLSTGIGGLVVLLMGIPSNEAMAGVLGLAAGVMITVSIFDMWLPAIHLFGFWTPSLASAVGVGIFLLLEKLIPESLSTGDFNEEEIKGAEDNKQAWRLALLMAITLTIHNVPEGIAVVVSSIESQRSGLIMTMAISLHNIPEGLVIATPCYASTGSRRAAILMSLASGLSEPAGAFVAVLVLRPYLDEWVTTHVLACVAGIMVAVSVLEIIPQAVQYNRSRHLWGGALSGSAVMALSLMVL